MELVTFAIALIAGFASIAVGGVFAQKTTEAETEKVRQRTERKRGETPAEKQYRLMEDYHTEGLVQSRVWFWFAIAAATVGFIVIIISIFLTQRGGSASEQGRAWVGLAAGAVTEAVSALFFAQSNSARRNTSANFDKLRIDRRLGESLELASRMNDPQLKSRLETVLALHLVDVKWTSDALSSLLDIDDDVVRDADRLRESPSNDQPDAPTPSDGLREKRRRARSETAKRQGPR